MSGLLIRSDGGTDSTAGENLSMSENIVSETVLWSLIPYLSPGGKSLEISVESPDGTERDLIRIGEYNEGWPAQYHFPKPIYIEPGSRLNISGEFESAQASSSGGEMAVWMSTSS